MAKATTHPTCTPTNLNIRTRSSTLYANAPILLASILLNFRRRPESHLQLQVSQEFRSCRMRRQLPAATPDYCNLHEEGSPGRNTIYPDHCFPGYAWDRLGDPCTALARWDADDGPRTPVVLVWRTFGLLWDYAIFGSSATWGAK